MLPRSLYGRAALILVLPIVTIQLLVSVVFIQRHFEGVAEQMTGSVVQELRLLQDTVSHDGLEEAMRVGGLLGMQLRRAGDQALDERVGTFDFPGNVVRSVLLASGPDVVGVEILDASRRIVARMDTAIGPVDVAFPRSRVTASNPHQLLVLMVVAGLLLTAIAYIFLRNQLRPIKRLAEAAEAFGKGRMLPYRPKGAEEVRAAGAAFVQMRMRIERQIEQRTLMLSGVSHDMRTPLTRMRLELSLLDPSPEVDAMLEDIADMERMLDAFLNFARGDAAELPKPVQPVTLLEGVVQRARRAGLRVELLPCPPCPMVEMRADMIARAVENLINNAGRHADRAQVSLWWTQGTLTISVEDDGPGIPPEQREEALRPFTRLDDARNQNHGAGVGLGLAIVVEAANAHGGSLRLGSSSRLGGLRADMILAR